MVNNKIYSCLWFDGQAKAAADFYCSLFQNAKVTVDTPMVVNFEIDGQKFMGLNGGPHFKLNPSASLFVISESDQEIEKLWSALQQGGQVMMPMGTYDWSEKYFFLQDQFGVSWQVMKGKYSDVNQKICLLLLFTGTQFGHAEEAVRFYTNLFPQSAIQGVLLYQDNEIAPGKVKHSQFVLNDKVFMAMDGPGEHAFQFNEACSFVVECDTQKEIDFYWNKLTEGGKESRCGWLKDRFDVSWQIIPKNLGALMSGNDPAKAQRVMQALMTMNKLDMAALENA